MAASSSPFFSPTTAPSYAPTAVFPPTPFGFGPPPCVPYTFPSAAAYPPPGCYFTSHSPFYVAPSAYPYPYAASFPAPASNFFPILPNWPPPAPDPTPSTAAIHSVAPLCVPESHAPSIPRGGPVYQINQSSSVDHPANPEFKGQIGEMKEDGCATVRHDCAPQSEKSGSSAHPSVASAPSPAPDPGAQQNGDLSSAKAASNNYTSISDDKFVHKHTGPRTLPMVNASPNHDLLRDDDAAVQAAAHERVPAKNAICHRRQRELLNLQARLDQQQARERNSFETIKDGLVKLTSMASQLTVALGMQTTKVLATEPSPRVVFAPSTTPATSALRFSDMGAAASSTVNTLSASFAYPTPTSDSTVSAALAYVVPQVLDELPTPQSGYESYTYGHPNPIQSSVHGESTNFSEQNLDGRPQPYGFHNLNRQSVFLADGSERSYFTLPADYPLERAVPESVFAVDDDNPDGRSNESFHVFANPPEQQPHEEEQQESGQLPNCFSKLTFSAEKPTVDTDTVGAFSLTNEQSICDLKKLNDGENFRFENEDISRLLYWFSKDLKCRTCDEVARGDEEKLWDKPDCHSATGNSIIFFLWDPGVSASLHSNKSKPPEKFGYVVMVAPKALNLCNQFGIYTQQMTDSFWSVLAIHERIHEWDPGDHSILSSTLNKDIAGGIFTPPYVPTARIQFGVPTCVPKQSCYCRVPSSHENHEIQFLWDPGILNQMDMILDKSAVPNLVHSGLTKFKPSIFVGQPIDLKHFWAQLLLPSHSWYNTPNAFLQVHYFCLPFVLDCTYSESVQQLVCSSCMFSSTQAIISAMCMSTAHTVHMILVSSSGEIAQKGRDTTAVYHVFKIQLPMSSKTSHIWDPGIALVYQQGVQKNYNANNLLAPQKYLQICEMDTIFITFLPP